jgi:hypothetical protein
MHMDLVQLASSQNRVRTMCRLLFRLIDPSEAVNLLDECLSTKEKREVQSVLGQAFRLLIGQATGHYRLNLAEDMDRDVFVRLMAVNKEERTWLACRYPGLDTSQHGNGHRFRNERLDGSAIILTPKFMQSVRCCFLGTCGATGLSPFLSLPRWGPSWADSRSGCSRIRFRGGPATVIPHQADAFVGVLSAAEERWCP